MYVSVCFNYLQIVNLYQNYWGRLSIVFGKNIKQKQKKAKMLPKSEVKNILVQIKNEEVQRVWVFERT